MGIFSKLKFWKHDDDNLDFDSQVNQHLEQSGLPPQENLGLAEKSPFDEPNNQPEPIIEQKPYSPPAPPTTGQNDHQIELISSKLDTIKAILNSLDQRVANLEQAAGVQKKRERLW